MRSDAVMSITISVSDKSLAYYITRECQVQNKLHTFIFSLTALAGFISSRCNNYLGFWSVNAEND
jgi:hypothetical protein